MTGAAHSAPDNTLRQASRGFTGAQWAAILLLIVTALLAFLPMQGPSCLFRALWHVPCPGCGLTRSLASMWHGDLARSVRFHPLGPPLFAWSAALAVFTALGVGYPRARQMAGHLSRLSTEAPALRAVLAALLGVWLLRLVMERAGIRFFEW